MGANPIPFPKVLVYVLLVAAAATAGAAVLRQDEAARRQVDPPAQLREIERFAGRRVTVTGRLADVISARSFTLNDGELGVLVLDVSVIPAIDDDLDGVLRGEQVQVTGIVRALTIEEMESFVGDLINERYEQFEGKPLILADYMTPK